MRQEINNLKQTIVELGYHLRENSEEIIALNQKMDTVYLGILIDKLKMRLGMSIDDPMPNINYFISHSS